LLFIGIVLFGCSNRYNSTVLLSSENFNEHFNLDFETVEEEERVRVIAKLAPHFDLSIIEINVEVRFSYNYYSPRHDKIVYGYGDVNFFDNSEVFQDKSVDIGTTGNYKNLKVTEFFVTECSGKIETYDKPRYLTKGFVTNRRMNYKIFNQMDECLEKVNSIYDLNNFSAKITVYGKQLGKNGIGVMNSEKINYKMRLDPFYQENEINNIKTICKYEGDQAFKYVTDEKNFVKKQKISTKSIKAITINDILYEADSDISFVFNPRVLKVEEYKTGYLITGYYKDFLSEEQYQLELEALKVFGSDAKEILNRAICKLYLETSEEKVFIDITVNIFVTGEVHLISARVTLEVSFAPITETDLYNGDYFVVPGYDIYKENYKSDINNKVYGYITANRHVYLYDLEAGQYIIDNAGNDLYQIKLYDKNRNEITNIIKLDNFNRAAYIFPILTSGEYYIELVFNNYEANKDDRYFFQVSKVDDETNGLVNPQEIEEGDLSFSIDNLYNIISLQYSASKNGIIVFNSQDDNHVLFFPGNITTFTKTPDIQSAYIFDVSVGNNLFYAHGPINSYSYDVMVLEKDKYADSDAPYFLAENTWSDRIIFLDELQDAFFSFEIASEGKIIIEGDFPVGNGIKTYFSIENEEGTRGVSGNMGKNWVIDVNPGKYNMVIFSFELAVTRIKYTFIPNY